VPQKEMKKLKKKRVVKFDEKVLRQDRVTNRRRE
jgi:hypothetical protein